MTCTMPSEAHRNRQSEEGSVNAAHLLQERRCESKLGLRDLARRWLDCGAVSWANGAHIEARCSAVGPQLCNVAVQTCACTMVVCPQLQFFQPLKDMFRTQQPCDGEQQLWVQAWHVGWSKPGQHRQGSLLHRWHAHGHLGAVGSVVICADSDGCTGCAWHHKRHACSTGIVDNSQPPAYQTRGFGTLSPPKEKPERCHLHQIGTEGCRTAAQPVPEAQAGPASTMQTKGLAATARRAHASTCISTTCMQWS